MSQKRLLWLTAGVYFMIILIGSQKGGVGKSTISVNMCAALANQGKDVLLVDTDRQSSSSNWAGDRAENKTLPIVNLAQKYDNIRASLIDFNNRYEYVIVDAAGRDSKELRTGLVAADILLMPVRPSQFDLDTIPVMMEMVDEVKEQSFKLKPTNQLTSWFISMFSVRFRVIRPWLWDIRHHSNEIFGDLF